MLSIKWKLWKWQTFAFKASFKVYQFYFFPLSLEENGKNVENLLERKFRRKFRTFFAFLYILLNIGFYSYKAIWSSHSSWLYFSL